MLINSLNDQGELFIENEDKYNFKKKDNQLFCDSSLIIVASKMINLFIAELFPDSLKSISKKSKF